jgi:uncharacterized protein
MKHNFFNLVLALSLSTLLFSCASNCSKEENPRKISVVGSSEMEIVPNEIYMVFTLKEYLDDTKQKVKLEDIKSNFLALCKTAGVADSNISIAGYSGNERWDYYSYRRRRTEPDFMASIAYTVKVSSSEKLDAIVAAVNDKALDNFYVSHTSHSDIEKLRREVKTNALKASKDKASYLAKSIGEEVGEALLIQEIDNGMVSDNSFKNSNGGGIYANAVSMQMETSSPSAPDFEKIKLRYEVQCEFGLK